MSTVAIIQARMSSTRFPGKHLASMAGRPMIDHVVAACERAELKAVIATSLHPTDDPLAAYCATKSWECFRGSLENPLERTLFAARKAGAGVVARITGDCPLVDWRVINTLVGKFFDQWSHHGSIQKIDKTPVYYGQTNSPDGTDVEVFTTWALERAWRSAKKSETEHTTSWIRKNLLCESVESDPAYADVHYSVNTIDDLRMCERMLEKCGEGAHYDEHVAAYRELKK